MCTLESTQSRFSMCNRFSKEEKSINPLKGYLRKEDGFTRLIIADVFYHNSIDRHRSDHTAGSIHNSFQN